MRDYPMTSSGVRSGTPIERRNPFWRRDWAACSLFKSRDFSRRPSASASSSACQAASRAAARFAFHSSLCAA